MKQEKQLQKERVLFVCIHNSARSQMAEAFLRTYGGDRFEAESAGIEPGTLNLIVVEAMREIGIDLSQNLTKSAFDFLKEGRRFHYVITVCDETSGERCPIFPGVAYRFHWNFEDPSSFSGTHEERLARTRLVRDAIRERILAFLKDSARNEEVGSHG
jgi:arsenate reductase (thioredoxin)